MVNNNSSQLDLAFASLADPTRRAILLSLKKGTATVKELAEPFDISLPAISRHLKVLERAGFLTRKTEGRFNYIELNPEPLQEAGEWIALYHDFWEGQLDQLGEFIAQTKPQGKSK